MHWFYSSVTDDAIRYPVLFEVLKSKKTNLCFYKNEK